MNASNDQNLVVQLNFANDICDQFAVTGGYFARLQRASEGSCESATGGSYHVVQSRCVGRIGVWGYLVVFGNL